MLGGPLVQAMGMGRIDLGRARIGGVARARSRAVMGHDAVAAAAHGADASRRKDGSNGMGKRDWRAGVSIGWRRSKRERVVMHADECRGGNGDGDGDGHEAAKQKHRRWPQKLRTPSLPLQCCCCCCSCCCSCWIKVRCLALVTTSALVVVGVVAVAVAVLHLRATTTKYY